MVACVSPTLSSYEIQSVPSGAVITSSRLLVFKPSASANLFQCPSRNRRKPLSLVNQRPPCWSAEQRLKLSSCSPSGTRTRSNRAAEPLIDPRKMGPFVATQSRWLESQHIPETPFPTKPDSEP